jgi:nucleotide-binding universal stress UspA family protein
MSYKHVIVPLDGSPLAECVLPHLKDFGAGSEIGEVELVRVAYPVELHFKAALPFDTKDEERLNKAGVKEAGEYLERVKSKVESWGFKVTTKVLIGPVADTLSDYLNKREPDLLLLATHGRSGPSRWIWGSVADKLLRSSSMPVFLVRPPGCNLGI